MASVFRPIFNEISFRSKMRVEFRLFHFCKKKKQQKKKFDIFFSIKNKMHSMCECVIVNVNGDEEKTKQQKKIL